MPSSHDEIPGTKTRVRKGFKADRAARYQAKVSAALGRRAPAAPQTATPHATKSITFDEADRRRTLLGAHKRKNERRVKAVTEARRKMNKANAKLRRELREEARQQYNSYARVPILPDYSFRFEQKPQSSAHLATHEHGGDDDGDDDDDAEAQQPATMADKHIGVSLHAHEGTAHTVEVVPLRPTDQQRVGTPTSHRLDRTKLLTRDLPPAVAAKLRQVNTDLRGAAQMKHRVNMLQELAKINKIKKHSRKGHGKKSSSGKRKNRK